MWGNAHGAKEDDGKIWIISNYNHKMQQPFLFFALSAWVSSLKLTHTVEYPGILLLANSKYWSTRGSWPSSKVAREKRIHLNLNKVTVSRISAIVIFSPQSQLLSTPLSELKNKNNVINSYLARTVIIYEKKLAYFRRFKLLVLLFKGSIEMVLKFNNWSSFKSADLLLNYPNDLR